MELKYIWVKKFKNLREVGFNINNSDAQRFEYSGGELSLSKNNEQTEGSFFGSNISSLTAIIGKNGSGKTNLADFIHYHLSNFEYSGWEDFDFKPIAIIIIGSVILHHQKLKINNVEELTKDGFTFIDYNQLPNENLRRYLQAFKEFSNTSYIYYSNIFYQRDSPGELLNLTNVSTNNLLNVDLFKSGFYRDEDQAKYPFRIITTTATAAYYKSEMMRISDYVFEKDYQFPFRQLPYFFFHLDFSKNNLYLKSKADDNESNIHNSLDEIELSIFWNFSGKPVRGSNPKLLRFSSKILKEGFKRLFLLNIVRATINRNHDKTEFNLEVIQRYIFGEDNIEIQELPKPLILLRKKIIEIVDLANWREKSISDYGRDLFVLHEKSYKAIHTLEINVDRHYLKVKEFLKSYKEVFKGIRLGYYSLVPDISAGESSLLTFYSRLHFAKEQLEPYKNINNLKIFIDEGELNLHPEWQRQFFDKIISFIEEEFMGYKVQLILTSHNPFLVSDIPKSNILFLDRDEKGNCKVANYDREQTFGANIHTLLSDSFFMDNGVLGEFAKNKITKLIDYLTNDQPSDFFTPSSAEALIAKVGEPIIQDRLQDLFLEKFGKRESLEEKIARLQKEMDEAKNQLGK